MISDGDETYGSESSRLLVTAKYLVAGLVIGMLVGGIVMLLSEGSNLFSTYSSLLVLGSGRAWLPVSLLVYLGGGAGVGFLGGLLAAFLRIPR